MDEQHNRRQTPGPSDEGSAWLYWSPKSQKWHRVELVVVPSLEPKNVRIQHLDQDQGGRAEWVPAGRLRVPWPYREAYLARESRWERLNRHRPDSDERDAAWSVLAAVVPCTVADLEGGGGRGVLEVHDVAALARAAALDAADLVADPEALHEDGIWFLPWPVTRSIAAALARTHPTAVLDLVRRERVRSRQRALDEVLDSPWTVAVTAGETEAALYGTESLTQSRKHSVLLFWAAGPEPSLFDQFVALQRAFDGLCVVSAEAAVELRKLRTKRAERIATALDTARAG
ncbi:hypothetical protein [Microbacterium sp. Clip185]|uniref:hypothetical protein n=1 Tax=Microbacterium sp. Clip185 TaxID=3025663 RepID=UPI002366EE90|nr:hypothetical protein [Microbacterium sp. Clip185]WDG17495.1 hypothetical protein PQV94_12815 [Microbacterium sp. Clip185]